MRGNRDPSVIKGGAVNPIIYVVIKSCSCEWSLSLFLWKRAMSLFYCRIFKVEWFCSFLECRQPQSLNYTLNNYLLFIKTKPITHTLLSSRILPMRACIQWLFYRAGELLQETSSSCLRRLILSSLPSLRLPLSSSTSLFLAWELRQRGMWTERVQGQSRRNKGL